jgi:hypothetical protein
MRSADRAVVRLLALSPSFPNRKLMNREELFAKAGVLGIMADPGALLTQIQWSKPSFGSSRKRLRTICERRETAAMSNIVEFPPSPSINGRKVRSTSFTPKHFAISRATFAILSAWARFPKILSCSVLPKRRLSRAGVVHLCCHAAGEDAAGL